MAKNTEKIKESIVNACKRGVCDKDGGWVPYHKRNIAGKGSHYIAMRKTKEEIENYEKNYERAFGHS